MLQYFMRKILFIFLILYNNLFAFNENYVWRSAMGATILTTYITNVFDASEGSVDFATSKDATMTKATMLWDWKKNLYSLYGFDLNLYKQASYSKWSKKDTTTSADASSNNALDLNALYRLENKTLFIEYSLGLSAMSNISLDREIDGGTLYFNHILALGVKYKNLHFSAKFQHYSNNGINDPNCAHNFYIFGVGWTY